MAIISAAEASQISLVRTLFLEYADSLDFDLGFQGFTAELAALPGEYAAPDGCILLAFQGNEAAGCIALKRYEENIGELKRLYVRPQYQGQGIGRALATQAVDKAVEVGYEKLRLDTVPAMQAAIQVYRSLGFYAIPAYRENPIPGSLYFEKTL